MENQVVANADAEKILGFHHRRKFLPPFQQLMIPAESGLSNPRKKTRRLAPPVYLCRAWLQ
jgi:hypothetical protein